MMAAFISMPFSSCFAVQKTMLVQQSEAYKDWQNFSDRDVSNVCIFLPRDLKLEVLCYPLSTHMMNVNTLAAHQLCKDKSKPMLYFIIEFSEMQYIIYKTNDTTLNNNTASV